MIEYTICSKHYANRCQEKNIKCDCTIHDYAVVYFITDSEFIIKMYGTLQECSCFINKDKE